MKRKYYIYLLSVALTMMWLSFCYAMAKSPISARDLSGGLFTTVEEFELTRAIFGGVLASVVQALSHLMSRRQLTWRVRVAETAITGIIAAIGIGIYVDKVGANLVWEMLIAMLAGLLGARGLTLILTKEAKKRLESIGGGDDIG
jgi:F0F1-type ATP synthase assembly protein I